MSGVGQLIISGPLLLALPVAAAAGAVTFLSPCVLPLVPGFVSYVTGMSGVDAERAEAGAAAGPEAAGPGAAGAGPVIPVPGAGDDGAAAGTVAVTTVAPSQPPVPPRRRVKRTAVAGTALFVAGFSAVFASEGALFGSLGSLLLQHSAGLTQIFGGFTILLGLLFAGVLDRLPAAGRILRPSMRPRAGLAGAPLLGAVFALSWTPCVGPTLSVVMSLSLTSGTALRGAILAFAYGLGLGIPFLVVAMAFQRGLAAFAFARRHARAISLAGGAMLVLVGVLEVTGAWASALLWLKLHWVGSYQSSF